MEQNTKIFNHTKTNKDVIFIAELQVSYLFLFRDQRFRGYCILSFKNKNKTQFEDLTESEYLVYAKDLLITSKSLKAALNPDHMNYEMLGNTNPSLHWHVVPRYTNDPRWGQPIWENYPRNEFNDNRHVLSNSEYEQLILKIRKELLAYI